MKSKKEPLDEIFDDLSNREVEPPAQAETPWSDVAFGATKERELRDDVTAVDIKAMAREARISAPERLTRLPTSAAHCLGGDWSTLDLSQIRLTAEVTTDVGCSVDPLGDIQSQLRNPDRSLSATQSTRLHNVRLGSRRRPVPAMV
jgi:hypothetical protein